MALTLYISKAEETSEFQASLNLTQRNLRNIADLISQEVFGTTNKGTILIIMFVWLTVLVCISEA